MSAIALLLLERGVKVTGSDLRPSHLTALVEERVNGNSKLPTSGN